MVWVRVGVLAATLAVCLARADEYGGVRMPQYDGDGAQDAAAAALQGGGGGDYRGHSPDAPALLDYKYEDDAQGNTEKLNKIVESKSWKKPARKQRGLRRDRSEPRYDGDESSDDAADLSSESRWRAPRGRAEPATPRRRRRRGRRGRDHQDNLHPMRFSNADYPLDKSNMLGEDVDPFTAGVTTESIIHRKPRDRLISDEHVEPRKGDDSYFEQDLISTRRLKGDQLMEPDEMEYEERRRIEGVQRRPLPAAAAAAPPPLAEEDEGDAALQRARLRRPNDYRDYAYYDSKKLPMLMRRTTTRVEGPSGAADPLAQLWAARRAEPAASSTAPPTHSAAPPRDDVEPPGSTATSSTAPPRNTFTESTLELSIAEKSRLSILKKSQKKEHDKGSGSRKPPVLLQVTSKLATIVMVEPASRAEPWLRARRVAGDSARQLERVKGLMRRKLVAGAGSMQELTDHWDDMVCDYIDVSLLEGAGAASLRPLLTCLTLTLTLTITLALLA